MKKEKAKDKDHFGLWTERGTTYVRMPLLLAAGGLLTIIALVILFWSVKRNNSTILRVRQPGELGALLPSIAGLTHATLEAGNAVEVLKNGDQFFPPLFRDIAAARRSIHIETFIWYDGKAATQLARLLAQKARAGVEVRLLVDGSGGRELDGKEREMLEQAGVKVAHFHPFRISNLGRLNNRDHRKLMIIDGQVGYIGGFCIADEWLGNAQDRDHFRDTGLRIRGPIVNRLQAVFAENWIEETGEVMAGEQYFPKSEPAGTSVAHVAYTSPDGSVSSVEILYLLAIKAARKEIVIQNPYLLPDGEALEALEEAVARGVDVRIMVPSDDATDNAIVQHASHHHFGTMLERGVKLWEYDRTLLHQKVIVVDGIWSCVGSTNFDERSFELNDEVSIGVLDAAVAAQLRAHFAEDLRYAKKIELEPWKKRSLWHKAVDGVAYLGRSQL